MDDGKIDHDEEIDENNPPVGAMPYERATIVLNTTSVIRNKVIDLDEDDWTALHVLMWSMTMT